jgi:hypothetical protein
METLADNIKDSTRPDKPDVAGSDLPATEKSAKSWHSAREQHLGRLLAMVPMVCLLSACVAIIKAPPVVENPVPVYVLDHGRHNSLVLTVDESQASRFAFGEWRWYVDAETGLARGLSALLRKTPGALGRGQLVGPIDPNCWVEQVGTEIRLVLAYQADQDRVRQLLEELNLAFDEPLAEPHYNPRMNLEFVLDEQHYSLGQNSNHRVVEWLRRLGFEVTGSPTLGRLRPDDPQRSSSADSSACSAASHSDSS